MAEFTGTVLVVGASGFVGRSLVRSLLADGRSVRCMARDVSRIQDLAAAGCDVVQGDILDLTAVERAMTSVRAVYVCIHTLSRQASAASHRDFMDVEEAGVRNLINGAQATGVRRLIYVTSIGVDPDAPSAWVRGRSRIERTLFSSGLDVTVLRPGMIVGRGGTGFDAVARGARRRVAIVLGDGTQKFRTIAVDDLSYYLVGVLDDPRSFGHYYDVGADDVLTTGEMMDIAAERLGRNHPIKVRVSGRLLGLAAPLLERAARMPRGAMKGLADSLQIDMTGDPAPIRELLGRAPKTYRQALEDTSRQVGGGTSANSRKGMPVRTLHIGLRVADREKSVAFYRSLGYEVVGTVAETPMGHLTMLKLPQDEFVTIELVSRAAAAPGQLDRSLSHLVVATESLDDTIAELTASGITAEGASAPAGPDAIRTAHVSDPDGNPIELVQWPEGHPAGMTEADFAPDSHDPGPEFTPSDRG